MIPRLAGIVLCGGRSVRMGQPKAWLSFQGEPMLVRVVRQLASAVHPLIVVAAPGQELPGLPPDVVVVRDAEEGRGPLQGLLSGLSALDDRSDAAYVSGCDAPLLEAGFVGRLDHLRGEADACVPRVDGRWHPLAAIYRLEVASVAEQLLADGRRRMTDLLAEVTVRTATGAELRQGDAGLRSLLNLNTPDDLAACLGGVG